MTIPHMTPIQAHFEDSNLELDLRKNADGHYLNEVTRYAWMNWMTAYSFGREHRENILNKTAAIALAEQAMQDQFITADEARALGVGNAEWKTAKCNWCVCGATDFLSNSISGEVIKYRVIRKQVPTEPTTGCAIAEGWVLK